MSCPLAYIPERLHKSQKPLINSFSIGEKLFYRCKLGECKRPYDNIPLKNISHNRNFCNDKKYPKTDVFFNINIDDPKQLYDNLHVAELTIKSIGNNVTYYKKFISKDNPNIEVEITLLHEPVDCMYSHSIFQLKVNGEIVTGKNYKKTLGRKNVAFNNLKSEIRQELSSIIQTGEVDDTNDFEYIDQP